MKKKILIKRFKENPLLKPRDVPWVNKYPLKERAVLNCGVIFDKINREYKMLFRGGSGSFSDIGLAISKDGIKWRVHPDPVLKHQNNNYWNNYCRHGIEDPRIVKWIDNYYYIFATAYNNVYSKTNAKAKIGIWKTKDFFNYQLISIPFHQWEDKNGAIFSEPIKEWVYLLHRRDPDIWISRTRDLSLKKGWQDSKILIQRNQWYDNSKITKMGNLSLYKIGIAGPPLKTPKSWLVITHVVHGKEENIYKERIYSLGFMTLDLENPFKIKYIHPEPILWPEKEYELKGNVNVVCFSCATVDTGDDDLYIYWGGADTVIVGGKLAKKDLPMCY